MIKFKLYNYKCDIMYMRVFFNKFINNIILKNINYFYTLFYLASIIDAGANGRGRIIGWAITG